MLHGCEDAVAGRGARVSIGFFFFFVEGRQNSCGFIEV